MDLNRRKTAFVKLGSMLESFVKGKLNDNSKVKFLNKKIGQAHKINPWFDRNNVINAFLGISYMLKEEKVDAWLNNYEKQLSSVFNKKNVAVIMAGNLPLVNFHDFLCVLITGHSFTGKLSSNDKVLPVAVSELLIEIEPEFRNKINFTEERLTDFDAVIATGSDNTSRYFDYYFGKYPNIIRKNRSSIAILDGKEDDDSLKALSEDMLKYYGMGCRSVSKIFIPEDYSFERFFENMQSWENIIDFYKYKNNYDYYKAMFLVNKTPHLDNGFLLLKEDTGLFSPLSVLYYQKYSKNEEFTAFISKNNDSIQCVVGNISLKENFKQRVIPFGLSQYPEVWDYADNIDTMEFLSSI